MTNRIQNLGMTIHQRASEPEQYTRWMSAHHAYERTAADYYRIQLGDAFFRRLHNTWCTPLHLAPVISKYASI